MLSERKDTLLHRHILVCIKLSNTRCDNFSMETQFMFVLLSFFLWPWCCRTFSKCSSFRTLQTFLISKQPTSCTLSILAGTLIDHTISVVLRTASIWYCNAPCGLGCLKNQYTRNLSVPTCCHAGNVELKLSKIVNMWSTVQR